MDTPEDEESELLILVDESGREIGEGRKLPVHSGEGRLHLAFSILVENEAGELLLQQRAARKYHFAELWSNACCGHPRPGEPVLEGGARRLREELGLDLELIALDTFLYRARDEVSGLTEHEFVHVLLGRNEGEPLPDPREVGAWRWCKPDELRSDLACNPADFTPWFPRVLDALDRVR